MVKAPWLDFYGQVPKTLDYPDKTMFELVKAAAAEYPEYIAYDFMGTEATYSQLVKEIEAAARAFRAMGIGQGDRVTVCLPNTPQAIWCVYALNYIGAVANMIHPLSSEGEIAFFMNDSESAAAVTLDQFVTKFAAIKGKVRPFKLIVSSISDVLKPVMKIGYGITEGRKIKKKVPAELLKTQGSTFMWKDFIKAGNSFFGKTAGSIKSADPAIILYSGGTTGTTKGIMLSSMNMNAMALQTAAMSNCMEPGGAMLAVMPVFHGFGLGVCVHTMLIGGGRCILVPRFNAKSYAELIEKRHPNYIAGVPTLYEAILRSDYLKKADLSCLRGVFSGGDSLPPDLKRRFDKFLAEHGASVRIREGFGTTECVTASCLTPYHTEKEGSIGLPFPDTFYKIVEVGTNDEVPYGTEGEICISGPSVMMGYVNNPEENEKTLRRHEDGRIWLHTGDLGMMDDEGYLYFRQRIKRMIVSSGYSIYPSQLETIIDSHPAVHLSCVIGVPDPYRIQKVKAFVVLVKGAVPDDSTRESIFAYCRANIAKYAMPYEIEFCDDLPRTRVGKIAYKVLEEQEKQKQAG